MMNNFFPPAVKPVFFLLLVWIAAGCARTGWLNDDPRVTSWSVYLEQAPQESYDLDMRRLETGLQEALRAGAADSLAASALDRVLAAYSRSGQQTLRMADNPIDADIVFRIDEVSIRAVRTLNVVHPGPVYRVRVGVSGWQGRTKVFEKRIAQHANLAVTAAEGARFYVPSAEERGDAGLQQLTIYPVLHSVFGQVWQEAADHNRTRY
ncbi:MAG: hypothetical protein LAT75_03625 [Candidatus Cyclonatronum sp.]|uniref:hypothetical protein n=1 Tax=Cyclonatronum sp. TaxID=3024185 RepID=UPI0025B91E57|nr:hypothetical protein [Cyclonatronum sp.]MCC5933629.1 hypothetical protein [Balneolales bacterium]MCH8485927.1 hypothetical protein [Cyclonatronum sp.]